MLRPPGSGRGSAQKETIVSPQASLISCIDLFFVLKLHVVLVVVSPTVAVLGATVFCRGLRRVWKVPGIHMACHCAVGATTWAFFLYLVNVFIFIYIYGHMYMYIYIGYRYVFRKHMWYIYIRRREAPMRQLSSQLQLSRLTASLAEFLVWVGLTWPGLNLSEPSSAMLLPFILWVICCQ